MSDPIREALADLEAKWLNDQNMGCMFSAEEEKAAEPFYKGAFKMLEDVRAALALPTEEGRMEKAEDVIRKYSHCYHAVPDCNCTAPARAFLEGK